MGVQVMCAGGLPSVSSGIGAGERLLKSGNFFVDIYTARSLFLYVCFSLSILSLC
jgi:hypothetical protein